MFKLQPRLRIVIRLSLRQPDVGTREYDLTRPLEQPWRHQGEIGHRLARDHLGGEIVNPLSRKLHRIPHPVFESLAEILQARFAHRLQPPFLLADEYPPEDDPTAW
jgi:hypothetical protein